VRSTADILRKRLKSVAPGNEHLASIIVEETGRLDGIVREFLDFARPQEPRMVLGSVNDVLVKLVNFMEQELEKEGIVLETALAENVPKVEFDHDQLYRACLNILLNSVQAMTKGGTLRVQTDYRKKPHQVAISIRDSGSGIPADKMEQIFTPFYTDKNRGTGLGLAIVKNIVDSHHGSITVESKEGEGTSFVITLPAK